MPKVLIFGRFVLFFWTAENGEPVHVHVSIHGISEKNSKFWIKRDGGCVLASNGAQLSAKDIRYLTKLIDFNHDVICKRWVDVFGEDSLHFYE